MKTISKSEDKPLSKTESKEFAKLDAVIKSGAKTFMAVGMALVTMHKGRLYRDEFQTFQAYCEDRGIKRGQAYNLMAAVQMTLELKDVQHVEQTSVRALTKLAKVPKAKREKVFKAAANKAGRAPTEQNIIEAVAEVIPSNLYPADAFKTGGTQHETKSEAAADVVLADTKNYQKGLMTEDEVFAEIGDSYANKNFVAAPAPKITPLTPLKFLDELLSLEKRIPEGLNQKEREKYGKHANDLANRLMNPPKKTSSAYTR